MPEETTNEPQIQTDLPKVDVPDTVNDVEREPSEMMAGLLGIHAMTLNMNNAVTAQQNAYTLNTAIISSVCARILAAGNAEERAANS